jgi:hypothetical protein
MRETPEHNPSFLLLQQHRRQTMFQRELADLGVRGTLDQQTARMFAYEQFEKLIASGKLRRLWAKVRGQSRRLLDLNEYLMGCTLTEQRYAGTRAVPVDQIRGSENRTEDFDTDFYPVAEYMQHKWINVAIGVLTGAQMPPVELIQVGDTYFVRDGHNRISVARSMGQTHVDAVVIVDQMREAC